jgi:hypothetical protein
MSQEPLELRPMTIADIIDATIRLYRHNFAPLLGIAAVVQVPLMVLQVAASAFIFRRAMTAPGEEIPWDQLAVGGAGFLVAFFIALLLLPLGEAALALAISDRYLGYPITVSGAYQAALRHWGAVLGTSLLVGLWVYLCFAIGLVLLILPGLIVIVWLYVRYMFAPSIVVVLEGRRGLDAMRRSWELSSGYFWPILGTMTILVLMISVGSQGITWPLQMVLMAVTGDPDKFVTAQVIIQAVAATLAVILRPVMMLGQVLLYYDLRIRKEGFDLMRMAETLGRPSPVAPAPAAIVEQPLWPTQSLPPTGQVAAKTPTATPQEPVNPLMPPVPPPPPLFTPPQDEGKQE